MTTLQIDQAVLDGFPAVDIAVVAAEGLDCAGRWDEAERALTELETAVAEESWAPPDETAPPIAAWHAVYRSFGTNPRRIRPSVDALCRRLARTGRVPRINGPVDAYNAVSIRHGMAAGAFDVDAVRGDIRLRLARDGDIFTPLGEPGTTERPGDREVVYADEVSVLTRHWNHRDAERTKVTPDARTVVFMLESAQGPDGQPALEDAARALTSMLGPRAREVSWRLLGSRHATTVALPTGG